MASHGKTAKFVSAGWVGWSGIALAPCWRAESQFDLGCDLEE